MFSVTSPAQGGHAVEHRLLNNFDFGACTANNQGRIRTTYEGFAEACEEGLEAPTNPVLLKMGYFSHCLVPGIPYGGAFINQLSRQLDVVGKALVNVHHFWQVGGLERQLKQDVRRNRRAQEVQDKINELVELVKNGRIVSGAW